MKRSEVAWETTSRQDLPCLTATLIDKDGLEWKATIIVEPPRLHGATVSTTLICRTAGRVLSTKMERSIITAQEWCYETLGIE
jgi:hypothetical protein